MTKIFLLFIILSICSCKEQKNTQPSVKLSKNKLSKIDTSKIFFDDPFLQMSSLSDSSKIALIKNIQNLVQKIDQQNFTDSIELQNEDFMENVTDGGGSLTGYFNNGRLVKMKVRAGLSWGVTQDIYYFKDEKLLYVLETEDGFHIDSTEIDHSKFDAHFEGNFYFDNNKMFDQVTLGHNRFEDDANDPEKEFLKNAPYYRKIIVSKRKKRN